LGRVARPLFHLEGPIHDYPGYAKNSGNHRAHQIELTNDENAKDCQRLATLSFSEKDHDQSGREQNY
jgi:hypothetical protein